MPINPLPLLIPIFLAFAALALFIFLKIGVKKVYTRNMLWKIMDEPNKNVVAMTDHINKEFQILFNSKILTEHLKKISKEFVPVEIIVIYDFGKIRPCAWRIRKVDSLKLELYSLAYDNLNENAHLFKFK